MQSQLGFFNRKKSYSTFFLTDADDRGISQEFHGNDIVYYIINPAKKYKASFFDKKGTQFFLLAKLNHMTAGLFKESDRNSNGMTSCITLEIMQNEM